MIPLWAVPEERVYSWAAPWGRPEGCFSGWVCRWDSRWRVAWGPLEPRTKNHGAAAAVRLPERAQARSAAREGAAASAGAQAPVRAGSRWCLAGSRPSGGRRGHCAACRSFGSMIGEAGRQRGPRRPCSRRRRPRLRGVLGRSW